MLCIAAESDPTGYVLVNGRTPTTTDLARMTGEPEAVVQSAFEELERNGVFSRDRYSKIYSRRMVRDQKKLATAQKNGKKGGNPTLCKYTHIFGSDNPPDIPTDKGTVNPPLKAQSPESRVQKESLTDRSESPTREPGAALASESEREFAEVWKLYPRHVARGGALKAYKLALEKTEAEIIRLAVVRFSEQSAGTEERFIPHFATWLNGRRWLDQPRLANGKDAPLPPGVAYIADDGKFVLTIEEIERREKSTWTWRLEKYQANQTWHGDWGPPPTDERCFLAIDPSLSDQTKHLLVEFGFQQAKRK